jgi:5-methyltetrahydrofolate--homocysteine methyltransferase
MKKVIEEIQAGIMQGDAELVEEKVGEALDAGLEPGTILREGMVTAMGEVGRLFEEGEYFVPEMLVAARAMKAGLTILRPYLVEAGVEPVGKVIVGTVKGDLHDIGKNLVAMMLEGGGFQIIDLGTDVSPEQFVAAAREHGAHLIGMSALLTTTMANMKGTVDALAGAGLREQVKVMVGGAPVTQSYAEQIGADGYAPDASQAVQVAKSLVGA